MCRVQSSCYPSRATLYQVEKRPTSDPNARSARLRAFLASFTVYLIPIVAPHIVSVLGFVLIKELSSEHHHKEPSWIAADVVLCLLLQLAAAIIWYWFFLSPGRWRFVGLVASVPVFVVAAEMGYMLAIPSFFLIDKDRTVDVMEWPLECQASEHVLPSMRTSVDLALARSGQVWVMRAGNSRLGVLSMPDCQIQEVDQNWSNAGTVPASAAPNGRLLLVTYQPDGSQSWEVLSNGERIGPFVRPPETNGEAAVLSNNSEWIGWVQREIQRDRRPKGRVLLQPVAGGDERIIDLSRVGAGRFGLLSIDMETPELLLEHDYGTFVGIDLEGNIRWGPVSPKQVEASGTSFLRAGNGWVAWDSYRDRGPYRVEWSLAGGSGFHEILKGRHVTSLAVDPEERFVALSISTALNIGAFGDKVYVIRTEDGQTVFQHSLPRYARSEVAFLTSRFFTYTLDREVRVLRVVP